MAIEHPILWETLPSHPTYLMMMAGAEAARKVLYDGHEINEDDIAEIYKAMFKDRPTPPSAIVHEHRWHEVVDFDAKRIGFSCYCGVNTSETPAVFIPAKQF